MPVQWQRLPHDKFLCTRFGPNWSRATGDYPEVIKGRSYPAPYQLTLPPDHELSVEVKALSADGSSPVYSATGLPEGAKLAPDTGALTWKVAGKPGQTFDVELVATSVGGRATVPFQLVVATEAQQLAWRAGVGGQTWPDCEARPTEQSFTEVDLDGDGQQDVLVSHAWVDPSDMHEHRFTQHYAVLRKGKKAVKVPWQWSDEPLLGDVSLQTTVDGAVLLKVQHHACDGNSALRFFHVRKGEAVLVGDFNPEPDDETYDLRLHLDDQKRLEGLTVVLDGKSSRQTWRKGSFVAGK